MTKKIRTFVACMNKGRKETITTRIISTTFMVAALAVFKPFGLDAWQWQAYVHLLVLWVLGIMNCMLTEGVLKYVVRKPRSIERGVSYIIRRNLWFQIINTPLVALLICLYRHFVMSDKVESNQLSWSNYFESLIIIAFCSFAIGLYWRFKFRSQYLASELRETRLLNEQLLKSQESANVTQPSSCITLTGTTSETLTLPVSDLLYVEAVGNYMKVFYLHEGQVHNDMLRTTSKQMEDKLQPYPMIVRCHRAFLVNLGQVEQIVSKSGTMQLLIKHSHEFIPVSRSNMAQIKVAIKA
ncbi:MAG: LytTR family transcriptional regulator [Bacteroidaceae bacterium]|nr:LytTR family transcriptional regulator [Bacteroidaceae bacterium]